MNKNMKAANILAVRKLTKEKDCICKRCKKEYSKKALERSLGKDSIAVALGYCSPFCYTKAITSEVRANDKSVSVMQQD